MPRSILPLAGAALLVATAGCAAAAAPGAGAPPATPAAGAATAAGVSAPISDVTYELDATAPVLARRRVGVTMRFHVGGDGPVLLSMPAWTPGAYEISNFARRVVDFRAEDASGRPLAWDKADPDTWRVQPGAAR